ncbi:acyl-CoA dehydrogenase [Saccharothrix sp. ALI-22-I]|uniref:acyl-CoA dehydrogenase family protein n=1 Tax=Saccharothrix sp. ALI-22-I TaxID=1933778 RepID=UPI00097C1262|nr:acyl-CoA dehydrogenase family protein [Saccharothrix sp. ALI-22-I]ONI91413.1 acyl-CoA dehydrogenase [Saccharothrix sp. ALI-22-I]
MRTIDAPDVETTLLQVAEVAAGLRLVAGEVDDGRIPVGHGYEVVRDTGLLTLLVPRAAGGSGLSYLDYTRVLEVLATGDAATALGYNMHNVAIGALCESAARDLPPKADAFRRWVFDEVVHRGRMFASATSEVGAGAKLTGVKATYRRTDDGFVLNGHKSFVSLAGIADYYITTARREGTDAADEVSHFVVARDDVGVSFDGLWDGAALNGTATAAMTMSEVRIGADRLFLGIEGMSLFKLVREPHWMVSGYMGAYLGVAESILRHTTDSVRADERKRDSAVVRADVGRVAIEVAAARALVHAAARLVDERKGSVEANSAVHAAKYCIGELVPRLAQTAVRICGSSALRKSNPLERLMREAAFCAVMPAKPDECLDYVGKARLGFNMFDSTTIEW